MRGDRFRSGAGRARARFLSGFGRASVGLRPGAACAQFNDPAVDKGPRLGATSTQRIKLGVIVKAAGTVMGAVATVPVPDEWPEQQVEIVAQDVSPSVGNLSYRTITGGGGARQMVVQIPRLPAGQEAHALVTFEVTRRTISCARMKPRRW